MSVARRSEDGDWWQRAVIYEIYPRSFRDSSGDGTGDLAGIISRLDYLNSGDRESLGVDAIWLAPIYPSPLFDFGYDISDYTAIDPMYGTMDDFELLTREAGRRGIHIIMDLVANHTSHEHAWFRESRSHRGSSKRNWYIWKDPALDGGPPNNWLSAFGGPAWALDEKTGQYYLHTFLAEQPDLNWRNPEVRQAIYDVVRFWIACGVDGFRLDAVDFIAKDAEFRDNPVSSVPLIPGSIGFDSQLHLYDRNQPIIHEWFRELRKVADEDGTKRLLVSEIYNLKDEDIRLLHGSEAPEMNMSFNFDFLLADWEAESYRAHVDRFVRNLPAGAWPNFVLNNHDQPRFISRHDRDGLGVERARLAAAMLLTLPGAAYLYYGEEIGMRNGVIRRDRLRDPVGVRFWPENPGRDPERTPMQWDAGPGAGFSEGEPWLPLTGDQKKVSVDVEDRDAGSLLSLYRRLIWKRKAHPALEHGVYEPVDDAGRDIFAYQRKADEERVLVVLNFAAESREVRLPEFQGSAQVLEGTHMDRADKVGLNDLELRALEGLVLRVAQS